MDPRRETGFLSFLFAPFPKRLQKYSKFLNCASLKAKFLKITF